MPLPLIPILLGGASIIAGGTGLAAGAVAISDNSDANSIIEEGKDIVSKAEYQQHQAQKEFEDSIQRLGEIKRDIYSGNIKLCQDIIDGLGVEGSFGGELTRLVKDTKFKGMVDNTSTVLGALTAGAGGLGVSALGIGGVVFLGSASTGTALSSLSGVALSNALTAWFGGGSLAAGGLGMSVGGPVLLGVLGAPALLLGGIGAAIAADEKLSKARSYRSKAKSFAEEVKASVSLTQCVIDKATMINELLCRLNNRFFCPLLKRAQAVRGGNYDKQSKMVQDLICTCAKVAETLDDIMNTPLLTKEGKLNPKIETMDSDKILAEVANDVQPVLRS